MEALIMAGEEFEDLELFYPYLRMEEEGIGVTLASNRKRITGKHGLGTEADLSFGKVSPQDYDFLIIPGGRGPEKIRVDRKAVELVKHFWDNDKPIAAICHGPQLLISALGVKGGLKGRKMACWKGIRDDLIAAGVDYRDEEVVVDGNLITSRHPGDLPAFCSEILRLVRQPESI